MQRLVASETEDVTKDSHGSAHETRDTIGSKLTSVQKELKELSENAQQLLTEKLFLENECTQLKKLSLIHI